MTNLKILKLNPKILGLKFMTRFANRRAKKLKMK